MNEVTTKQCKACQEIKPVDQFYRDYQRSDKLNRKCKPCIRAYLNAPHRVERQGELVAGYQSNPEWRKRRSEYQRKWIAKRRLELSMEAQWKTKVD